MCCDPWQVLWLHNNQIGDRGFTALAEACGKGAMPKLWSVDLRGNPGSSEPMNKVLQVRRSS